MGRTSGVGKGKSVMDAGTPHAVAPCFTGDHAARPMLVAWLERPARNRNGG
jgi:hypothetical protein